MEILKLLKLDKDLISNKRAERFAKTLSREQQSLIDSLEEEKDELEESMELLKEFGDIDTISADEWVSTYQDVQVSLELVSKKLEIAKRTQKELFTN